MKNLNKAKMISLLPILILSTMLIALPAQAEDTGLMSPASYATGTTGNPASNPAGGLGDDVSTGSTDSTYVLVAKFRTINPGGGGGVADSQIYQNFSLAVPTGATIDGIEVVVSAYREPAREGAYFQVALSGDAGGSWTSYKTTSVLGTTDAEYTLGGATDKWGASWGAASLSDSNFRLDIIAAGDLFTGEHWLLDSVQVRVYFTGGTAGDLTGQFRTQTQGGWGQRASGDNAGVYRDANFGTAFSSGLNIGDASGYLVSFTTAGAIEAFLPTGGTPGALDADATDPTETSAGVLAGQVVALTLNVGFDLNDADFSVSSVNLKDLVIVDTESPCSGWTVAQVLAEANKILAGLASALTASEINDCVSSINENFVDGTVNKGFLGLP